jgi:hypothetical protein
VISGGIVTTVCKLAAPPTAAIVQRFTRYLKGLGALPDDLFVRLIVSLDICGRVTENWSHDKRGDRPSVLCSDRAAGGAWRWTGDQSLVGVRVQGRPRDAPGCPAAAKSDYRIHESPRRGAGRSAGDRGRGRQRTRRIKEALTKGDTGGCDGQGFRHPQGNGCQVRDVTASSGQFYCTLVPVMSSHGIPYSGTGEIRRAGRERGGFRQST